MGCGGLGWWGLGMGDPGVWGLGWWGSGGGKVRSWWWSEVVVSKG